MASYQFEDIYSATEWRSARAKFRAEIKVYLTAGANAKCICLTDRPAQGAKASQGRVNSEISANEQAAMYIEYLKAKQVVTWKWHGWMPRKNGQTIQAWLGSDGTEIYLNHEESKALENKVTEVEVWAAKDSPFDAIEHEVSADYGPHGL